MVLLVMVCFVELREIISLVLGAWRSVTMAQRCQLVPEGSSVLWPRSPFHIPAVLSFSWASALCALF